MPEQNAARAEYDDHVSMHRSRGGGGRERADRIFKKKKSIGGKSTNGRFY
jgi:hypothetical protein